MDEEIQTVKHDKLKAYHSMVTISEAFPALGIVAAVLGVIKAMGALDQAPEVLGAPDRRRAGRHLRGHLLLVCGRLADRQQHQGRARKEDAPLHHRQADAAGVHERGHAPDCARARTQDHLGLRAADDRRGRAGDAGSRAAAAMRTRYARRRRSRRCRGQAARERRSGATAWRSFSRAPPTSSSACRCCAWRSIALRSPAPRTLRTVRNHRRS